MIHARLVGRRLACVPWLLAAGLVLGWSGEAAANFKLSVNPSSVREDAGATEITVTVEATDDTAVNADTYVILGVSNEGLNSRFQIRLTALRILAGEKKATGTLTLIPNNDDVAEADLRIELRGTAGKTVESAFITLIDDDKDSQNIHLSADIVEVNRFDDATEIVVTATLDGKVLRQATSFSLIIGDHPDLGATPNADEDGDGDMDDDDATKDNREAQRDLDYTVRLTTLTIPRNSASGTATITITPNNRLPGTVRLASPDNDAVVDGIQIEDGGLTLKPVDLKIKKEVAATADAIALSQERIREDAGETTIELKVTLTNVSVEDETVRLVILSDGEALPSPLGGTVTGTPTRDVHYKLVFGPPLIIPAGASEGTTTFTLTPVDDAVVASRGPIYIQVTIGDVSATKTITIADDDANSTNISLTVEPATISEAVGATDVAVTGTLDGKVFDDDVVLLLTIDSDPKDTAADGTVIDVAEAQRDIDYSAILRPLTIPAGSVSGTTTISVTPIDDGTVEGDEKIRLTVPYANKQITADAGDEDVKVTIGMVDITLTDPGEGGDPFFAAGASIADQTYTVGTAIADLVLPEAAGGDGTLTYRVSALPAGLSFDAATRTLSGTPTEATNGAVAITYTAADEDDDAALLTFTITSAEAGAALTFAADASIADQTYTVGTAIADLVLPRATGGAGDLRYRVLPLPAGLSFDAATRTLSGTPTKGTNCPVEVIYMVTDSNRDAAELTFSIMVHTTEVPPVMAAGLTAEPAVIREDAEATAISLTFTLQAPSATDESVGFEIVAPSDGTAAVRDVDYAALLEGLITIPAGATEGIATLVLTPFDDNSEEGLKALAVQATLVSTGQTLATDIEIRDDETPSTSISLSADPSTLSENAALTTVAVTATLDGQVLAEAVTVHLVIDDASTATRDLDYSALFTPVIEIPAGSITGMVNFYVDPRADNLEEGDEIIRLVGTIDGLAGDEVEIVLTDPAAAKAAKAVVQTRPEAFSLANNFPNPFNPATTIEYALPQAADVELTVYNAVGQVVRTLVAEYQSAGRYAVEWDATNESGYRLSSGMYFYHLQAGAFREVKKMLLLR